MKDFNEGEVRMSDSEKEIMTMRKGREGTNNGGVGMEEGRGSRKRDR